MWLVGDDVAKLRVILLNLLIDSSDNAVQLHVLLCDALLSQEEFFWDT
jgi:hypothetical protein